MMFKISKYLIFFFFAGMGCISGHRENLQTSIIQGDTLQTNLFNKLVDLTGHSIPENRLSDSLSFMIIPIDASCNYCRDKSVDSLNTALDEMNNHHFAIITGNGMKAIKAYFSGDKRNMPVKDGQVFVDFENKAYLNDLVFLHPTFYYSFNKRVYVKVKTVPITIHDDLRRFFVN
ncbi:hypothetical protein F0L74_28830 [Chitinophaga agrisoli]|uniref:AhpC/TSA family protein n=1 Tax=Chitinophaga agrisoli TaxID=2607653 RepID=A0A5B2VMG9_9BACT|nr:hypothetical protein [Chitinophaga agrisoli]KAA2240175.1 hypothetical protein F0L74_28830 [Chitinophaga agrisoli]